MGSVRLCIHFVWTEARVAGDGIHPEFSATANGLLVSFLDMLMNNMVDNPRL